jgi:hypothetical protein
MYASVARIHGNHLTFGDNTVGVKTEENISTAAKQGPNFFVFHDQASSLIMKFVDSCLQHWTHSWAPTKTAFTLLLRLG